MARSQRRGSEGFTLVELLIVVAIIPLIVGSIALALLAVFQTQSSVADRLGTSGDAQVVAANFYRDVQNATMFTTKNLPTSPTQCGAGQEVLGLEWTSSNPASFVTTVVSYGLTANGVVSPTQGNEYNLVRYQCSWSPGTPTPSLVNTSIISFNVPANLTPVVHGQSCTVTCQTGTWAFGWVDTNGIQAISFAVNEAAMSTTASDTSCASGTYAFCYTVASASRHWLLSGAGNTPVSNVPPALFVGLSGTNIAACNSRNPDLMVNGTLVIDSNSSSAITGGNGGKDNVYATSVNYYSQGGVPGAPGNLNSGTSTSPMSSPMPDPLANLVTPSTAGLPVYNSLASATAKTVTVSGTTYTYVNPGVYNFDLSGSNVILNSGPYIMNQGISGSLTSGVGGDFIYLAGGSMNSSQLNLSPMTTGSYAGIGLWVPTSNSTSTSISLGPGSYQIGGITYVPGGDFGWYGTPDIWLGALLSKSTSCSGGGNGQTNIGYSQSLTFSSTPPSSATVGGQYIVGATSASPNSGNPVTYSIDPLSQSGACTVSGSIVHFTGVGTCLVDANQAQSDQSSNAPYTGGYLEAPTIQQSFQIAAAG